jgi:phenylacetate-coenzyme A ligase PaaK-like adenylate-forming protein
MGGRRRDPRRFGLNKTSRDIDVALRRLVNDAYAHVRTFRERMGVAGVHPDAIT